MLNLFQESFGKISCTMDLWTDPSLWPYMAVTAHWLQAVKEESPTGSFFRLTLRCDLIGFHRIPTRHTGEHLASTFMWIIDRLNIAHKVRFFIT